MKFAGLIAVIFATSAVGVSMYDSSKKRLSVCRELIIFCDCLRRDFMYRSTPVKLLVSEIISEQKLVHLSFIKPEFIGEDVKASSPLENAANKELSAFLSALGRSDTDTQLDLISSFRSYLCGEEEKLKLSHAKNARLYLSFGVFSGVLIALIFV